MSENKYTVKVTQQARQDIIELDEYISIELSNPKAAEQIVGKIEALILSLDVYPYRVKYMEEEPWKSQGIQKMAAGKYNIYFWTNRLTMVVYVILVSNSIRHESNLLGTRMQEFDRVRKVFGIYTQAELNDVLRAGVDAADAGGKRDLDVVFAEIRGEINNTKSK